MAAEGNVALLIGVCNNDYWLTPQTPVFGEIVKLSDAPITTFFCYLSSVIYFQSKWLEGTLFAPCTVFKNILPGYLIHLRGQEEQNINYNLSNNKLVGLQITYPK